MNNSDNSVAEKTASKPIAPKKVRAGPAKPRSILGTVFSLLALAFIAVVAFNSYLRWDDIVKYTSPQVCKYNVLGSGAKAPTVPPIDLKKPAEVEKQSEPAAPVPKVKTTPEKVPDKAPKKVEETKIEDIPVVRPAKKDNLQERWQTARKMFWNNDDKAAAAYEKLVQDYPGKTELVGELGNVYYKNGNLNKAAEMFFEAGNQFKTAGKMQKVAELVDVLKELGTEKSKDFAQKLSTNAQ